MDMSSKKIEVSYFLPKSAKKIFLCMKDVQKTEKNWKKFWKNFEIFFHKTNS